MADGRSVEHPVTGDAWEANRLWAGNRRPAS
jgi:hypothetical protein